MTATVHPPLMTVEQAKRKAAAAQGALTRAFNRQDDRAIDIAEKRLDAAIARLEAVQSQVPDRTPFRSEP